MPKKIEDFTLPELIERKNIQDTLNDILLALKESLQKHEYDNAILYNLSGTRMLSVLINKNLSINDEEKMLEVLQENVLNILRIQNRLQ